MAASSLTAAALGSKVAFANKVRLMNNASFRLCALSFIVVVSHVRALLAEEYKREIIFPVKFYHLSLCKREEHSRPKREEKGLQNAFFYAEEDTSRDVNEDLFERE